MGNVVLFPIVPRPVPHKREFVFRLTVVKANGRRVVEYAPNKTASMDLLLDALHRHPDAKKISVIKEERCAD
jgi:hypothetical protein